MSQAQRALTIEEFGKKTKQPLVLLISLKAGGVGLNLTMANRESLPGPRILGGRAKS